VREAHRPDLALRFRRVIVDVGGAQVWVKGPAHRYPRQVPETDFQVRATPAVYPVLLSSLQEEAVKDHLSTMISDVNDGGGLHRATLDLRQRGQPIIHIHLREVPRLLRAAIVIDDMGNDLDAAHKLFDLNYPVTFSVLPYRRFTQIVAQEAHRKGHEVMLHLPMEADSGAREMLGQGSIMIHMNAAEVQRVVESDLASVPYVSGVNNHMGSRATKDAPLMADVMKVLAAHRLYFIDSRTTAASAALDQARRQHLPAFYRAVFLDDTQSVPYTLGQLQKFRHIVEQQGVALAIGHPHPTTIAALAEFLPELEEADIELVPASQIVRLPEIAELHPPARRQ